ncbi:PepSY-associated TM helix domain-containing protein [Aquimarina rhabdastrellae]
MNKRNYNVFFHTHTVSGIVISVALYVIFFCGAFALFKNEFALWEKGEKFHKEKVININYDRLIDSLNNTYELYGRDIRVLIPRNHDSQEIFVSLTGSKDSLATDKAKEGTYFNINSNTYKSSAYYDFYSLGELIYRLHFFSQIPSIGTYLAGFIALFFLFAIVTGVLIHWKKIVSNFYVFRPKAKLKTIWTDAHTVLGMIGLPFQFVYALTSVILCMTLLILLPANYLYDNNQQQLLEDVRPMLKSYPLEAKVTEVPTVNTLMKKALTTWDDFTPQQIYFKNYGAQNMKFQVDGWIDGKEKFLGNGRVIFDVMTGKMHIDKDPYQVNYLESVEATIRQLHFADYGGLSIKILYFVLALITGFVIISGVLIWLEARNKKAVPLKQQLYNLNVGYIYLAICLTLYPIIAISFHVARWLPRSLDSSRQSILYAVFFLGWLALFLFFRYKRDNQYTHKYTLWIGSIFGLLLPITNGFSSGNWIWKTFTTGQYEILFVDIFWIVLSSLGILIALKSNLKSSKQTYTGVLEAYETEKATKIKEHKTYTENLNTIPMRTKITLLWIFIALGFIFHHIYGLATVFFNETVFIEGSTGETPMWAHKYRILMEGLALLFALFTLQVSKPWFRMVSLIWSCVVALFNVYHVITAIIYEASNLSEIFILILMAIAGVFLVLNLNEWRKLEE